MASDSELISAIQRLSLARSVEDVQRIVRTAARRLTGSDGATFVLRDGPNCYYADEDAIHPLWKGQRFPLEACISGWAMLNRRSTVIPDIYVDDRIPHAAYRPTFVKSLVMVPIRSIDPIGAIGNYWADHHEASPEEVAALQALADSTAVAMENVALLESLEARVALRTAELEEARMGVQALYDESLAQAENLRADLGNTERLINTLAHEVRNPLAAAVGCLDLLSDLESADNRMLAGHAQDSVSAALQVVSDQLESARTGANAISVHLGAVDLARLLRETEATYRALGARDGLLIAVEAPAVLEVTTDRRLLAQIVRNLVSNALKFTERGTILMTAAAEPGGGVSVSVRDQGIGIAPEDQARIFEEFEQVEEAQEPHHGGTGLGLPLVQRLAGALGGRIELDSTPGEGSTFTVFLPASPSH